ncbi:MAG: metallophosphoesterase [Planctomycetaceae bacterium]|nr:metallophosphoesterase [Planctomycetaceae bacterium]MBT4157885.1 metallophosphoesterase [Planctomycetaceae bacterium]MBT6056175.1 metallophosphoesterase [Planctomycetaceae bacterium]
MGFPRLNLSRRQWIQTVTGMTCGIAGGLTVQSLVVTPQSLSQTHLHIGTTALPGEKALRIVQLSDLHLRDIGALETMLLESVKAAKPDVILLTGDAISHKNGLHPLSEFLGKLPPTTHRIAIMGNWEYKAGLTSSSFQKYLRTFDFQLLVNESCQLEYASKILKITGFDDLLGGQLHPIRSDKSTVHVDEHLVLAHCPATRDIVYKLSPVPPSLILSGHTHGGQIAPGGFPLYTPPGSGDYVSGWYRDYGPPLYVSRGIGTSLLPLRIGSLPELVILDWQ